MVLIGIFVVIVGFALKLDSIAVIIISALTTGFAAHMDITEILSILGKTFVNQRLITIFILTLPIIGISERYGLKEKAVELIKNIKNLSTGKLLTLYCLIRQIAGAMSLRISGHPQFVRPLINPMAQGAAISKYGEIDKKYEDISSNLKNIYYELQEISRDISEHKEDVYFDEQERNEVEERLDLIYNLKRKYGNDVQEILNYKDEIEAEINHIENLDEYNNKLKKELKQLKLEMTTLAEKMHELRNEYGKVLSININKVLEDLEMKNANINIHVDYNEEEFFENGKDIVEFYITTNLGEDEKQLAKIASGGEMSRIMLAIKKVLADTDKMPVLIFDEIDTGISGKAAGAVAEKLNGISKNHQVLCISHLPSIAAIADYNYFISKRVINERTNTNIKLLNEKETLEEIARISSGEINEATIQYAMQLRNKKVS